MEQQKTANTTIKRPSFSLYLSDGFRALKEFRTTKRFLKTYSPTIRGDQHPVLVIPGFMAGDGTTKLLRKFLEKAGYQGVAWGLGTNLGKYKEDLAALEKTINALYREKNQAVSLIGWSLGGVYARQLAKKLPEKIRQVITLGSPFADIEAPNNARWVYRLITIGKKDPIDSEWLQDLPNPAPVPTTAFYSKKDGIVPWKVCMEKEENEVRQNIEVTTSHLGMGASISVFKIIETRLPLRAKNWKKYEPVAPQLEETKA